jgi:Cu+-exporting ATPase
VLVRVDGMNEALIEVGDVVRLGSYRAVDRLRRLGVKPVLATGDRQAPAQAVAKALGIDEVHARCTPEDKAALVRDLQEQGYRVAVIGDGVNDAAALAGADRGIAMGTGTDVRRVGCVLMALASSWVTATPPSTAAARAVASPTAVPVTVMVPRRAVRLRRMRLFAGNSRASSSDSFSGNEQEVGWTVWMCGCGKSPAGTATSRP